MKFIHLSDLHLGKRVNEYSMLEDQEYILKKIINIVDAEKPDGVIIAGDVYDKSVPAAEAEGCLAELRAVAPSTQIIGYVTEKLDSAIYLEA